LPVRRMISAVPQPSAVASTILARQTCFYGLLRSVITRSRRAPSVAVKSTTTPLRMSKPGTAAVQGYLSLDLIH
jgi:hypothetical protein